MFNKYITPALISGLFLLNGCNLTSTTSYEESKKIETKNETETPEKNTVDETPKTSQSTGPLKQIDVLVIVDSNDVDTNNGKNRTKIDHFMSVTNQIFQNSTVPAKLNIVKVQPYSFSKQDSKAALREIYKSKSIAAVRNSAHADIVVIYRKNTNDGLCGLAYLNQSLNKNIGFAHVSLGCPSTTTAHEVGHTLGLNHSMKNTSRHGKYAYGHGYGVEGEFSTIMSYKSTYHTNTRVFNFSSPDLECKGYECGDANTADSVKALKNSIATVSNFR